MEQNEQYLLEVFLGYYKWYLSQTQVARSVFGLLQMVFESDTSWCASTQDAEPKWVDRETDDNT